MAEPKRPTLDRQDLPGDLRELMENLAHRGISMTPATLGPDDPLPEPVRSHPHVSLSELVIRERDEQEKRWDRA